MRRGRGASLVRAIVEAAERPLERGTTLPSAAYASEGIEGIYRTINAEDRARLESVQGGLASRFARPGRISRYENMNWEFTRYLARALSEKESTESFFEG